ncbi:cation:proton antiporter [Leptospira sp. 2 VSF19]|uniref:Cation:proton antiporter n=1 Tax=Leptospira soteropolitanensis TaxID=2950025 RepID=A0AAW5VGL5_9LEPT|nr:cation:proton antiporter [Leptospira soteropolitanensis]MCW7491750.1 cation:proton antiporter [Leptospira soteropolitanensis]MCW7499335.1 cation:proton antiporter [Leptospira soteropolitanensis]MCW7521074.1 cation:proton antiporter [Leptospira soteropolitanensis]MCW7525438.1 cation:proton antiporter [Leptospira soteropolitanensis]MCW7529305.1 cation:proton antiporter [Leptospira soteropolitanensis]
MHGEESLLQDIGLSIIFATVLSHIARVLKQPLILGYIIGGALLGKEMGFGYVTNEASIELISEIGLILLLFIIGLEINLAELAKMGKAMFTLGILQFTLSVAFVYSVFPFFGLSIGSEKFDLLYIAVALSLSSTLIVVKLLQDKVEINTLSGKLTVGVLVFQDIWAILFMGVQPNLNNPEILKILTSVGIIVLLIAFSFSVSRYVLAKLYKACASSPELILLTSIMWCFLVCGIAGEAGLSKEMGALVAGMSIAAFPYGADVISKLIGIRDFFVTLFFVALGLKVPLPSLEVIGLSTAIIVLMLFVRMITIAPVIIKLNKGVRNGFLTALNLAQISEFSLVILALGAGFEHITPKLQAVILTSTIIASVLSTYIIMFNHNIAATFERILARVGISDQAEESGEDKSSHGGHGGHGDGMVRDIIVLGYFRIARAFVEYLEDLSPSLIKRIIIADYNPAFKDELTNKGFQWAYADLAHPDSLSHIGLHDASMVICTISDSFLKGTNNNRLLSTLSKLAPNAKIILTSDEPGEAKKLVADGAQKVIIPGVITGEFLYDYISRGMRNNEREV